MTRLGEDEFLEIKKFSETYEDYANDVRQRQRNLKYKRAERARKAKVNQATFNLVKKAQNNGLTLREIQSIFDLGHCTIERIKASESFDGYKKLTNDRYKINMTTGKEDKLDTIKILLEQIVEKLDNLEISNKKKWFR